MFFFSVNIYISSLIIFTNSPVFTASSNSLRMINEFALLRNKFLGLLKAIDAKQFQINNIVKLRVAGLDDAELFAKK